MKHDLAAVQTFLVGAIQRSTPIAGDARSAEQAAELVTGNERLSPAEQVDIYRRQFFARLRDLMGNEFPGLLRLLGAEAMARLCRAFLEAHPPAAVSFRDVFEPLPRFVETYPGFASAEERALAADMARYEFAHMELHIGPDAPPLDPAKLAGLPADAWERARIVLHPLSMQFAFDYPVHRLLKAWTAGEEMAVPAERAPVHVALFRSKDLKARFEELEPEAFALLAALRIGKALVPALAEVADPLPPERRELVGASIGRWFQQWTAWGIVIDVELR
jgi:hypothetical protein